MNTILITGVTGFLGGAVAASLLGKQCNRKFIFLVRAESEEEGLMRLRHNLKKFDVDDDILVSIRTKQIVIGDLSIPEEFIYDPRLEEVSHVINCAAVASFGSNPLIWKVNVEGTFTLAERMSKVAGLKRFIHVGTAMSCAPSKDSVVKEGLVDTHREQHIVEYTWSKAEAERMMLRELPELPLLIVRPSIIVGHSRLGCSPSPSIFWVFRMALMLGKFMCNLDDRIDVIPVDYCADAISLLLMKDNIDDKIIHISAGIKGSVMFCEIDEAMARASHAKPVGDKYQKMSYQEINKDRKDFKKLFGPCNERIMMRAINLYGHFSRLNVVFSNDKLLESGMPQSPRFTDYLDCCVESTKGMTVPEMMAVDFK